MEQPVVSIVVPVYNTQKYLSRCIGTILQQTYKNFELILVDDGSTDDSFALCEKWSKRDKRIVLIHQENGGASLARNTGIEAARGKYITFVDSDDWVAKDYLEVMISCAEENNVQLVVASFKRMTRRPFDEILPKKIYKITDIEEIIPLMTHIGFCSPCNKLFLCEIISKNNLSFSSYIKVTEDIQFVRDYLRKCKAICTSDQITYYYGRLNVSSITRKYHPEIFEWYQKLFIQIKDIFEEWNIESSYIDDFLNKYATKVVVDAIFMNLGHIDKCIAIGQIQYCIDVLGNYISPEYIDDRNLGKAFKAKDAQQIYNEILITIRRQRFTILRRKLLDRIINPWLEVCRDGLHKYDYLIGF